MISKLFSGGFLAWPHSNHSNSSESASAYLHHFWLMAIWNLYSEADSPEMKTLGNGGAFLKLLNLGGNKSVSLICALGKKYLFYWLSRFKEKAKSSWNPPWNCKLWKDSRDEKNSMCKYWEWCFLAVLNVRGRGQSAAAAAAAKLLQSCPTLCDPIDGSPPGSSVHGIFQAGVLEWGAVAFSTASLRRSKSEWESLEDIFIISQRELMFFGN